MNACIVLNILLNMARTHVDTAANFGEIQKAVDFQKQECQAYEAKNPKKDLPKMDEKAK